MTTLPFILYGDGPRLPTGLARIARDLASRLVAEQATLGIRFAQVGVDYPGGFHWKGWDFCGFQPTLQDQGRGAVEAAVEDLQKATGERPIVFMVMDPSRCYDLLRYVPDSHDVHTGIDAEFWGYYPLDAQNRLGGVGGPAKRAILTTARVLAYGRYGQEVLTATYGADLPAVGIPYLPHGIDLSVWHPDRTVDQLDPALQRWGETAARRAGVYKIGCVATNQARKDLGLLFSAVAELKAQGLPVALWLHTDKETQAWDVGELAFTCGLQQHEVALSCSAVSELSDQQLAAQYAWSDVTFAPGLGEGFGYPIVESLACGTPVVHGNYAGGVELIPNPSWLVEPCAWRLESIYALLRPVFNPRDVAQALLNAADWKRLEPAVCQAYCAGSVAHLDWSQLWPRWRAWFVEGLEARRGATT